MVEEIDTGSRDGGIRCIDEVEFDIEVCEESTDGSWVGVVSLNCSFIGEYLYSRAVSSYVYTPL